jgi:eukaryotic-like serine/threonine-protein kinase
MSANVLSASDWQKVSLLFEEAIALPPDARATMLAELKETSPELAGTLARMLETHAAFTTQSALNALPLFNAASDPVLPEGTLMGAYSISKCLGVGGMGRVYQAHRELADVSQTVAIKCIRFPDRDPEFMRRFLRERRILASLNHPNIARFLDAGTDANGKPFVVLEYVDGVAITEFARTHKLDLAARIRLLLKVMSAVAYSHRQLIVHRDLKPGNVLVTADGEPRLLDFGIAKTLTTLNGQSAPDGDTAVEQRAYSINYAAPEQLRGEASGTAVDIYALGILAYELLCAQSPLNFQGLSQSQAERQIFDVFPEPPSQRGAKQDSAPDGSDAKRWFASLRGDLDNIVLHALKKEANERYATVEAFMADLQHHLQNQPISLRGGQRLYRLQRFVRRHRLAVALAASLMLAMLTGIGAFVWQANRVAERAAQLEQVSKFQAEMLSQIDPTQAGRLLGKDVNATYATTLLKSALPKAQYDAKVAAFAEQWRYVNATDAARNLIDATILKPAMIAVDKQFQTQPLVDAAISQVLGDLYRKIRFNEPSLKLHQRALAIRQRELGDMHPDTLTSLDSTCGNLWAAEELEKAEQFCREALEKRRYFLGEEHPDTLTSLDHLAVIFIAQEKLDDAETTVRKVLALRRRIIGESNKDTLDSMNSLAVVLWLQGRLSEAAPLVEEVLVKYRQVLGGEHPTTILAMNNLGAMRRAQGRLKEAEAILQETLSLRRRISGEEHPDTFVTMNHLALTFSDLGRIEQAEPLLRATFTARLRLQGPENSETMTSQSNLCSNLYEQDKLSEAEPLCSEVLERLRQKKEGNSYFGTVSFARYGALLLRQKKHADVVTLLEPQLANARSNFEGDNIFRLGAFLNTLGSAKSKLGDFAIAEKYLLETQAILIKTPGSDPANSHENLLALVALYQAWQQSDPGKNYAQQAQTWQQRLNEFEAKHPDRW